jgi:intracellular sulfur oxidation DsrE/DsrF family protein
LTDEAYRRRFGVDNPNRMLLQELIRFGVRVVLCGQTQTSGGFQRDEILPDIQVALSAMTALVALQDEGYRLIPY